MGVTILAQWVDVAQRLQQIRNNLKSLRNDLLVDPKVEPHYVVDCRRISSEVQNLQQEVTYLYETLLQAQAALEYTGEWAEKSSAHAR